MRQFLRYEISGIMYFMCLIIFIYLLDVKIIIDHFVANRELYSNILVPGIVVFALPIGVIIHQLSIVIKNWMIGKIWQELSDFPEEDFLRGAFKKEINRCCDNDDTDLKKYCLERITNLNTFYYVRFDNGFLAPLLAFFTTTLFFRNKGDSFLCSYIKNNFCYVLIALFISLATLTYIYRIYKEMKKYRSVIATNNYKGESETSTVYHVIFICVIFIALPILFVINSKNALMYLLIFFGLILFVPIGDIAMVKLKKRKKK